MRRSVRDVRGRMLQSYGTAMMIVLTVTLAAVPPSPAQQSPKPSPSAKSGAKTLERTLYDIRLSLDFDARRYEGTQRILWFNRGERPTSALYFHLYPNLRSTRTDVRQEVAGAYDADDEPRLEVTRVAQAGQPLDVAYEDGGVTMRVQLRGAVQPGASTEVEISFRGVVPLIELDETSLPAHVIQQVGAVLRDTRETRRARDTNFFSRGIMLLGNFYPLLAPRVGGEWRRRIEASIGGAAFAEAADYRVRIEAPPGISLFGPGGFHMPAREQQSSEEFVGNGLRRFALLAGRNLRSSERMGGAVNVRSVYTSEHEKVGLRVLETAAEAARIYTERFGPPPFDRITVAEAPLVAGLGSTEFSGLAVVASAFYVDFDSPAARTLPQIVREQRSSVEDSLEFATAQGIAHQWWGAGVGSDPAREPVLDEGLTHWSSLLYVREAHGEERARIAEEDQLRGVYQLYRTFGGEDMTADRPAREYRNSFQYAAIVASKGALMLVALRQTLGDETFFRALRSFYESRRLGVAELSDLRAAFVAVSDQQQRRAVNRLFERWLSEKRGDEDIGPPNPQIAGALGLSVERQEADRNAFSRLGRFFWRQMTRIR